VSAVERARLRSRHRRRKKAETRRKEGGKGRGGGRKTASVVLKWKLMARSRDSVVKAAGVAASPS
jgi:hypothetical protein